MTAFWVFVATWVSLQILIVLSGLSHAMNHKQTGEYWAVCKASEKGQVAWSGTLKPVYCTEILSQRKNAWDMK